MSASVFSRGALILIDKPQGITSHDAVERVRRATGEKKIGHSGTLDPMASGLLVLCAGKAARLQSFFTGLSKSYQGEITLGRSTSTFDREGEVTFEFPSPVDIPDAAIEAAAERFRGEFEQTPPPYSAKKVGGRKFYEMARRGEPVPAAPKTVAVSSFRLDRASPDRLRFTLSCSTGTYVRSIAHELGLALGCGAHLSALRRTSVGGFRIEDAAELGRFEEMSAEEKSAPPATIPLDRIPFPFAKMALAQLEASRVKRGQSVPARIGGNDGDWVALTTPDGEIIAIGQIAPIGTGRIAMIRPRIVLAD